MGKIFGFFFWGAMIALVTAGIVYLAADRTFGYVLYHASWASLCYMSVWRLVRWMIQGRGFWDWLWDAIFEMVDDYLVQAEQKASAARVPRP